MKQMSGRLRIIKEETTHFSTKTHHQYLLSGGEKKRILNGVKRYLGNEKNHSLCANVDSHTYTVNSSKTFVSFSKHFLAHSKEQTYSVWPAHRLRKKSLLEKGVIPLSILAILGSTSHTVYADEPPTAEQIITEVIDLINGGQLEAALTLLRKEAKVTPNLKEIADRVLEQKIENADDEGQAWFLYLKGLFAYTLSFPEESFTLLEKALSKNSKFNEQICYAIIEVLEELGYRNKSFFARQWDYYYQLSLNKPDKEKEKRLCIGLARSLLRYGHLDYASYQCNKALLIDWNFREANLMEAHILRLRRKNSEALEWFKSTIRLDPNYLPALHDKAVFLAIGLKKHEKALRLLDKLIEKNPNLPYLHYNYAYILSGLNHPLAAFTALLIYDKAIDCDPEYFFARYNKAYLLNQLGKVEEAINVYKRIIKDKQEIQKRILANNLMFIEDELVIKAHINIGNIYAKLWEKAYKGLTSDINDKVEKYYRKALKYFNKALLLNKKSKEALFSKALLLKKNGKLADAKNIFKEIINEIDSTDKWSHYHVANILYELGEYNLVVEKYIDGISAVEKAYAKESKKKINKLFRSVRKWDSYEIGGLKDLPKKFDINTVNEDGDTLLIVAVKKKRVTTILSLLLQGADIEVMNKEGKTAISIAEELGDRKILEQLLNEQQQRSQKITYRCFNATSNGDLESVKNLLQKLDVDIVNERKESLLMTAVKHKQLPIVQYLIEKGANIQYSNPNNSFKTAIELAVEEEAWDILELLLKNRQAVKKEQLKKIIAKHISHYEGAVQSEKKDIEWINTQVNKLVNREVGNMRSFELALKLYRKEYIAKYLSMLHAINKEIQLDEETFNPSSGWRTELFLPLRIRALFALLIEIQRGKFNEELPVSDTFAIEKLINELITNIETLRARRDSLAIRIARDKKIKSSQFDQLITAHAENIYAKMINLNEGEEYSYDTGYSAYDKSYWFFGKKTRYPGHTIYVNFYCVNGDIIIRADNLGDGVEVYHEKLPMLDEWKPFIIGVVPKTYIIANKDRFIDYIKAIIKAKLEPKNLKVIYSQDFKSFKNDVSDKLPANKSQTDNSCVTSSHDVGMEIRLGDKEFYQWVKEHERLMIFTRVPNVKHHSPQQAEEYAVFMRKAM